MAPHLRFTSSFGFGRLHAIFEDFLGAKPARRVFAEQDLPLALTQSKTVKVPQRDVLGLHGRAARVAGDELFGLRIGQGMHPEDFGRFARYAVQAPDLKGMLSRFQRALRYHQNSATFHTSHEGDFVRWSYRLIEPWTVGRRHHANHAIPPMIEAVRRFFGDAWRPLWIELEADRGHWAKGVEDFFEVPVFFGCRANALIIDPAAMHCRNRQPVPIEKQLTMVDLRRMAADKPPESFTDQISAMVALRLMDRQMDIDSVAAKVGISARTLQRKLDADGTSYRAIVDRVRHRRSIELLAEGTNSVVDIASSLGYSDDSHFIRAFRRWTGRTPKSVRTA